MFINWWLRGGRLGFSPRRQTDFLGAVIHSDPQGVEKNNNTTNLVSPENNSFVATLTCVSGLGNRGSNTTHYKLEMKMSDTPPACMT